MENTNKGSSIYSFDTVTVCSFTTVGVFSLATVGVFHQQSSSSPRVLFTYHLLVENTNKGSIKSPLLLFAPLPLLVFFTCHCWCFSPTVFLIVTCPVYISFVGGKHQQRLNKITTVAVCSFASVGVFSLATVGVFH
ncbi:hypothetical protein ES692_10880, partial [Psychroserpens burtonensis]